ncbi:20056_t:CDS:1, partial [Cetraspora pellucida]
MPKITSKRLDPSNPNESLVEQQVHGVEINEEKETDEEIEVISNKHLKEIKSWIDSTKHYSLSG